jgi:uncharacterized phosphosugar-binding protein
MSSMKNIFAGYSESLNRIFEAIGQQEEAFRAAAAVLADAVAADGLINVVGTGGHANMAVEEVLWRAGSLAPINAILDAGTNLIHGAKRSNIMERTHGYAASVLKAYGLPSREGEPLLIVNAYGINPMTLDMCLEAKKLGMKTIAITSRPFADSVPAGHASRHNSGKSLYKEADIFLDCHMPYGDAIVEMPGMEQKTGATATFCLCYTIDLLMLTVVKTLLERGIEPPLWMSANLPGGDEANLRHEEKYYPRVKHLR